MLQSSRQKIKRTDATTFASAISELARPIPLAPWESSAVTIDSTAELTAVKASTPKSNRGKKKNELKSTPAGSRKSNSSSKKKSKSSNMLEYDSNPWAQDHLHYEPIDYSNNFQSYDVDRTLATSSSRNTISVPDTSHLKVDVEKLVSTTVTSTLNGFMELQKRSSTTEFENYRLANEKARLDKETALADLVKERVVASAITSTEMQTRLTNESLQDIRIRTQGEYEQRMYIQRREADIRLNDMENTNNFKLAQQALTNENERKLKVSNSNTEQQVKLMETTSNCNRNQAIFNQFGINNEDEESEKDE